MKVIGVFLQKGNADTHESEDVSLKSMGITMLADSSLLKEGKPFFMPDFCEGGSMRTLLVYRICRLGKNISRKFAHRYWDAVTVGVHLRADKLANELTEAGLPLDMALNFDSAMPVGEFIPSSELTADGGAIEYSLLSGADSTPLQSLSTAHWPVSIDTIIEHISRYYTLKIGDLIAVGGADFPLHPAIGQTFDGSLQGRPVLSLKIK